MNIAVLGPKGTFSDKAFLEYNKQNGGTLTPEYCDSIDEVFDAVKADSCELGIVPIENTLDGYVMRTLDRILEDNVCILDENRVEVQFALVANAESLDEIETLYVQFKAEGQCRKFISKLKNVKLVMTESNMESFYKIGDTKHAAAIVPKHITEHITDKLVVDCVTDADYNHTRFVVIKKGKTELSAYEQPKNKEKVRIPIYIMPAVDRPGILYMILRSFYENKINLISIMSRPTKQEIGTYNFYIEIDALYSNLAVIQDTLAQIEVYNDLKILGIYAE